MPGERRVFVRRPGSPSGSGKGLPMSRRHAMRRRSVGITAAAATAIATIAFGFSPDAAVPGTGFFELDRNADTTTASHDWDQVKAKCDVSDCATKNPTATGLAAATGIVVDLPGT